MAIQTGIDLEGSYNNTGNSHIDRWAGGGGNYYTSLEDALEKVPEVKRAGTTVVVLNSNTNKKEEWHWPDPSDLSNGGVKRKSVTRLSKNDFKTVTIEGEEVVEIIKEEFSEEDFLRTEDDIIRIVREKFSGSDFYRDQEDVINIIKELFSERDFKRGSGGVIEIVGTKFSSEDFRIEKQSINGVEADVLRVNFPDAVKHIITHSGTVALEPELASSYVRFIFNASDAVTLTGFFGPIPESEFTVLNLTPHNLTIVANHSLASVKFSLNEDLLIPPNTSARFLVANGSIYLIDYVDPKANDILFGSDITSNYSFLASDNGKLLEITNGSTMNLSDSLSNGWNVQVVNLTENDIIFNTNGTLHNPDANVLKPTKGCVIYKKSGVFKAIGLEE